MMRQTSRRSARRIAALTAAPLFALAVGLWCTPFPAQAQDEATDSDSLSDGIATDSDVAIGAMLGDEAILSGRAYTYDAGDRRDPFKSLLVVTDRPTLEGPRPDGIPGLLIDEIVLSGIFATRNGYVAQVQAADQQKSYLIKAGDDLYDGEVLAITRNEVVFKQDVQDPTALKPFNEVTKSLKP